MPTPTCDETARAAAPWSSLAGGLAARVSVAGFDVLGAVRVSAYNDALPASAVDYLLPDLGVRDAAVLVVGNARRLWAPFVAAAAAEVRAGGRDPLDVYTRRHIGGAVDTLGVASATRYSFDVPPCAVSMQRLAAVAGIAELAPVGLSIHPELGPWFSLRAAVVLAVPGPPPQAPPPTCSACAGRPCVSALAEVERAMGSARTHAAFAAHWEGWLAVRDACPIGTSARFSGPQLRYHYTKDLGVLSEPPLSAAGARALRVP